MLNAITRLARSIQPRAKTPRELQQEVRTAQCQLPRGRRHRHATGANSCER